MLSFQLVITFMDEKNTCNILIKDNILQYFILSFLALFVMLFLMYFLFMYRAIWDAKALQVTIQVIYDKTFQLHQKQIPELIMTSREHTWSM